MKFILIIFVIFVITKVCVTTNVKTVKQKIKFQHFRFVLQFSGSVRQRWSLPSCGAIAEYESNTFQLERICRDETLDHTYNFILYLAKEDSCQWTNIARQNHSVCETREKSAQVFYVAKLQYDFYFLKFVLLLYLETSSSRL